MRSWTIALALAAAAASAGFADHPVVPVSSSRMIMISDNDSATIPSNCTSCAASQSKIAAHFTKPRPEPTCFGCSTWRCEWRFLWGSCKAFYGEGRFAPAVPAFVDEP